MKNIYLQIQEAQEPQTDKYKENYNQPYNVKLLKTKNRAKIINAVRKTKTLFLTKEQ